MELEDSTWLSKSIGWGLSNLKFKELHILYQNVIYKLDMNIIPSLFS